MPSYPRPFACRNCNWTLGESYRADGKRITQLRVFRRAVQPEKLQVGVSATGPAKIEQAQAPTPRPADHVRFAVVQVNDCTVLCEHCGAETSWYANQTAIEDMLVRRHQNEKPPTGTK